MERIVSVFALLWAGVLAAGPEFCSKGFQVATRYHDCWQQSKFTNKYPELYERHEFMDADFLERFASHMCSVVKPDALACFKKDVRDCPNRAKLIAIADESGGACKGNQLNPFFKEHVINHLVTVKGDRESPCFTIGDSSYDECYIAAGRKVLESGKSDEISRFHYVADMFFETYWDCLIKRYKAQAKLCPHWQIPMLLVLQKTALPSLFGMHLKPEQVYKLELTPPSPLGLKGNATKPETGGTDCDKGQDKKVYLLMQILSQKPSLTSAGGNLVVELSDLNSDTPKISLQGSENMNDKEVMQFVQILSGPNTEYSLKERRRRRKEERKKNKRLKNISSKLKGEEVATKKAKKNRKTRPKPKTKKSNKKQSQRDKPMSIYDKMV